jgi:CRP/FNR family transcriptional regulator, cyclic AMP receptor protein
MASLLDFCSDMPLSIVEPGTELLTEGKRTGRLLVLVKGRIEILRGATQVTVLSEPGSVLGEMSIMLDEPHTATAKAVGPVEIYVIEDGETFLKENPGAGFLMMQTLAKRLNSATTYLVDLKRQFAGQNNHLEMVGEVLESLIFQQQRRELKPGSDRDPRLP